MLPATAATIMATTSDALPPLPGPEPVFGAAMTPAGAVGEATGAGGAAVGVGATAASCWQTVLSGGGTRVTMYLSSA